MLYTAYENGRLLLSPITINSYIMEKVMRLSRFPITKTHFGKALAATCEMTNRMTKYYGTPEWGINYVKTANGISEVNIVTLSTKKFCKLLHFKKDPDLKQKKLLLVAPMAGHYSTLLLGTVEGLLPHFDIYVTDWINARDVPVFEGQFDLNDYVDHMIEYLGMFGGDVTVMAVCQPTVPVMAAISYMAATGNRAVPENIIVVGGPIDARENPTQVNDFAVDRSLAWFGTNLITRVPAMYSGAMRKVYPGFLQLHSFMSMNMDKHTGSHLELFKNLIKGDGDNVEKHRKFYDEYLAVMDIPAEYYLQTIDEVFHKFSLAKGQFVHRGITIDLSNIKDSRLLAIEGELDDIAGIGQTKAAIKLCAGIKSKFYHLQKGVGHYGLFNGRKFREQITPVITNFAYGKTQPSSTKNYPETGNHNMYSAAQRSARLRRKN